MLSFSAGCCLARFDGAARDDHAALAQWGKTAGPLCGVEGRIVGHRLKSIRARGLIVGYPMGVHAFGEVGHLGRVERRAAHAGIHGLAETSAVSGGRFVDVERRRRRQDQMDTALVVGPGLAVGPANLDPTVRAGPIMIVSADPAPARRAAQRRTPGSYGVSMWSSTV